MFKVRINVHINIWKPARLFTKIYVLLNSLKAIYELDSDKLLRMIFIDNL